MPGSTPDSGPAGTSFRSTTENLLTVYGRHVIEEYSTANGLADYALVVDGQLLGEAKKVTLGLQNVLTQAERSRMGMAFLVNAVGKFLC